MIDKELEQEYQDYIEYTFSKKLKLDFPDLEKITDKWGYIRQAYMEKMPYIIERARFDKCIGIDPYFIDWGSIFSPIEGDAWHAIRSIGRVALYPQFPLFNYFIDFANPYLRIGLELDGKDFHDSEKDKLRDQKLYEYGWKIFRIKGSECYTKHKQLEDIELNENDNSDETEIELKNWFLNTCEGVIFALREVYFTSKEYRNYKYYDLALQTLYKHRLAEFPII